MSNPTPIGLMTASTVERLLRSTRISELNRSTDTGNPGGVEGGAIMCAVEVLDTPAATVAKYYPAKIVTVFTVASLTATPDWVDYPDEITVWVRGLNGEDLVPGTRYYCAMYTDSVEPVDGFFTMVGFIFSTVPLVTANVDTTEESTTTRLEFDQSTGVRVDAGATDADPDVVSLDLTDLFTKSQGVLTQGCLDITLTKTYSTNPGETHLLTDVSLAYSLVFKQRSITLLGDTTIGAEVCVAAETECCEPPVLICAGDAGEATVSRTLKVVVSGGPTFNIVYDPLNVWWQGYVNAFDCSTGFGLTLTPNCDGTWDIQTVASFRGPASATVTPTSTSPFLLTVTGATESGLCGGTVTFTVEEV